MEEMPHCVLHHKRVMEYTCLTCKNRPMCESCKVEHETGTGHASGNCKEVGLAIMHQHVQCAGGRLAKWLAKRMRNNLKELEAGLLREIDRFQEICVQTEELSKMKRLDSEGRYAELYLYAKSLNAGGTENEAAMRKLNKRLIEMLDKASDGFKKVMSNIAAAKKYKPVFAAYKKDDVLAILKDEPYETEEQIVSALHSADMPKCKAVYIDPQCRVGDLVASELASRLQTHPVSALYLNGYYTSDAGAEVLARAAFRGKSFTAFCVMSFQISDTGAKAVAEAARNSRSLTTLYLFGWEISDSGAIAVAEAVKGCPLSVFYLWSSNISDAGATAVADSVKSCPLSAFYLCGGEISDAGAIDVAKTMKDCSLSAFCLGSREISESGATAVAEILSSGRCASTLSALFLMSDRISNLGAKKVADAVRGCPRLSAFYLRGKLISGEAVTYILENMAGISTIRSVNLGIDEISKEQMDSCLNRLQQSGAARQLKLRFECVTGAAKSVCEKLAAKWNAKLAEFRIVHDIENLFRLEVILGMPT